MIRHVIKIAVTPAVVRLSLLLTVVAIVTQGAMAEPVRRWGPCSFPEDGLTEAGVRLEAFPAPSSAVCVLQAELRTWPAVACFKDDVCTFYDVELFDEFQVLMKNTAVQPACQTSELFHGEVPSNLQYCIVRQQIYRNIFLRFCIYNQYCYIIC